MPRWFQYDAPLRNAFPEGPELLHVMLDFVTYARFLSVHVPWMALLCSKLRSVTKIRWHNFIIISVPPSHMRIDVLMLVETLLV